VVSVTDPYGRLLGFLARSRFFFFLNCAHDAVDPVRDPLLLRKSDSTGNRTGPLDL
jgi:hypothetical protein